jgi:hypothetical protein
MALNTPRRNPGAIPGRGVSSCAMAMTRGRVYTVGVPIVQPIALETGPSRG